METNPPVFVTELTAAYKDQLNLETSLKVKGETLAVLEYTIFRGEVQVSMITVRKDARRKGYATMLVKNLQSHYPDNEIDWGMVATDSGQALLNSLPFRVVPSEYAAFFAQRDSIKQQFNDAVAKLELIDSLPEVSPRERQIRLDMMIQSSELDRQFDELDAMLDSCSPTVRFVEIVEPVKLVERSASAAV